MNFLAIMTLVTYFAVAGYHGKLKSALDATAQYGLSGAWFMAGFLILWALHQEKSIREPVDIFTAIVLISMFAYGYKNIETEIADLKQYLGSNVGGTSSSTGSALPSLGSILPSLPSIP